jgi:hypothetical protein
MRRFLRAAVLLVGLVGAMGLYGVAEGADHPEWSFDDKPTCHIIYLDGYFPQYGVTRVGDEITLDLPALLDEKSRGVKLFKHSNFFLKAPFRKEFYEVADYEGTRQVRLRLVSDSGDKDPSGQRVMMDITGRVPLKGGRPEYHVRITDEFRNYGKGLFSEGIAILESKEAEPAATQP